MAVHDLLFERPFLEVDGDAYVSALATSPFYELAASAPLTVVADFAVEWDGSFDLILTWDEIQRLIDALTFTWIEVPKQAILNNTLTFSWNEQNALDPMLFTWVELPAGLLDAYELDPQRPYGRVSKP